jgi:antitoxin ParD1/3/4
MDLSLTAEQLQFIEQKLKTGRYKTAADVVRDGLQRLMEQEAAEGRLADVWRSQVREKIEEGWAEAERGECVDGEAAFDQLKKRIEDRRNQGK